MANLQQTNINDTGFLQVPVGTTGQRLGSPNVGYLRYNTTESYLEVWNGEDWLELGSTSSLYAFTSAIFTSGGQEENTGPSLATARNGLTGPEADDWKNNTEFFNTSNGIQSWIVPANGNYRITAAGARGGGNGGGDGAIVRGTFALEAGDRLWICVGQTGTSGPCGGGGGGGTFVTRESNQFNAAFATFANASVYPLVVGGGGGGQRDTGSDGPQRGSMGTFGTFETGQLCSNDGQGGPGGSANGGGGFLSNGGQGSSSIQDSSDTGKAFILGAQGSTNGRSPGKFGGGSGATCERCNTAANAGAGGGYSGGGIRSTVSACYVGGGGGGSFIHSTVTDTPATSNGTWSNLSSPHSVYTGNVSSFGTFNTRSGYVQIELV